MKMKTLTLAKLMLLLLTLCLAVAVFAACKKDKDNPQNDSQDPAGSETQTQTDPDPDPADGDTTIEGEIEFSWVADERGYRVKSYKGSSAAVAISATVNNRSVTSIGDGAFIGCAGLTSVTIPGSVTSIGEYAFCECIGLTELAIPNSVTSIGEGAFQGCAGLTSVTIGNGVTSIGDWAFGDCTGLVGLTIPNSVTSIGGCAFYGCTGLTSVTIGNGVTSIGDRAFYECTGLTSVTIPNGVTSVGSAVFGYCTGLTSVTIPDSLTSMDNSAFYECNNLTYNIYDNAKYLGNAANPYVVLIKATSTSITSCTIDANTKVIASLAFQNCSKLTDIAYQGTKAQWNAITKLGEWNIGTGAYIIHCTNGDVGKYKVSFKTNNTSYAVVDTAGYIVELPEDPTREGYLFGGWYYDDGTWERPFDTNALLTFPVTENIVIYAKWVEDDPDDKTAADLINATGFVISGNTASISVSNSTEAFSFIGAVTVSRNATWQICTDIYGMNSIPTKTVPLEEGNNTFYLLVTSGDGEHISLYTVTVRRRPIYTVTFDTADGTAVASRQVEEGGLVTWPADPARTGYTFTGWDYSFSKPITAAQTITANWQINTYNITYTLNGGTNAAANPASYTIASADITLQAPTRAGYTFTGWTYAGQTTPTATVTIPHGSTGARAYTANWQINTYNITYTLNGGTNAAANPATYTVESTNITLQQPTRTGYTFTGWTYAGQTTPTLAVTISHGSTGAKAYTANWQVVTYNITYTLNGGTNAAANPASYTIESANITLQQPTRTGYTFTGWTYAGQTTPKLTVTIPHGSTGDRAYTANWSATAYSITYTMNGGTNAAANPASYTIESTNISLQQPTRAGYTFTGWTYAGQTTPTVTVTIPHGSTGAKAYTANWQAFFTRSGSTITGLTDYAKQNLSALIIPAAIDGTAITSIGSSAFSDCRGLTSVTIPNSVTSIGDRALQGCAGLTSVTIPSSVTSIGSSAFYNCTGLTSVTIPDGVTSIGRSAFSFCTGLTSITIPDSVTSIGDSAFRECTGLTSITYQGTKAQWNAISKGSYWKTNTGSYTIHCTDGDIAKS